MAKYNADQCNTELDILNQGLTDTWCIQAGKLYKKFTFANFSQAFAFMTQIALYAEKANHHPEWTNNYKHVEVYLISHDVGGLSARDFELAQYMECCVLPYLGKSGARLGK